VLKTRVKEESKPSSKEGLLGFDRRIKRIQLEVLSLKRNIISSLPYQ
jgi:hypothetical protein